TTHDFYCFNHPPPTEIYTLSLHDALPIYRTVAIGCQTANRNDDDRRTERPWTSLASGVQATIRALPHGSAITGRPMVSALVGMVDRKSTRLNSSHVAISYAVFCLKKKKEK